MNLDFIKTFVESEMMPFARTLGLKVLETAPTQVKLALPDKQSNHNHIGFSHAGAQYTLAEMTSGAMCFAALIDIAANFDLLMAKGEINYKTTAKGDIISVAEMSADQAESIRQALTADGKVRVPQIVRLYDQEQKLVAECDFLVYLRMRR